MDLGLALGLVFCSSLVVYWIVRLLAGLSAPIQLDDASIQARLVQSPEWLALMGHRQEIEQDPTLDETSKSHLLDNWRLLAEETRNTLTAHLQKGGPSAMMGGSGSNVSKRFQFVESRSASVVVSVGLVGITFALVWFVGGFHAGVGQLALPGGKSGTALGNLTAEQRAAAKSGHPGDGVNLQERMQALKDRLSSNPDDLRGWVLLSRTQAALDQFSDSAESLKQALRLSEGNPHILADLADMTAMANGKILKGEPERFIAQALQSDPMHEKALALAATAAEQSGEQEKANQYWERLNQVQSVRQAQAANEQASASPSPATPDTPGPASKATVIATVNMSIDTDILKNAKAQSALFVFLKSNQGPGMPLAVVRVPADQIRERVFTLAISQGDFIQQGGLDAAPEVLFAQARWSVAGVAAPSEGDITSEWLAVSKSQLGSGITLNLKSK